MLSGWLVLDVLTVDDILQTLRHTRLGEPFVTQAQQQWTETLVHANYRNREETASQLMEIYCFGAKIYKTAVSPCCKKYAVHYQRPVGPTDTEEY